MRNNIPQTIGFLEIQQKIQKHKFMCEEQKDADFFLERVEMHLSKKGCHL